MRRAAKRDANHTEVGDYLRNLGWSVLDVASCSETGCDLIVSKKFAVSRPGFSALVEIKNGELPPSARKLTENEQRVKDDWQGPYIVALSGEDAAVQLLCLMRGWE